MALESKPDLVSLLPRKYKVSGSKMHHLDVGNVRRHNLKKTIKAEGEWFLQDKYLHSSHELLTHHSEVVIIISVSSDNK